MNFKKLPKQKRTHLILVLLGTVLVLGGLGWFLVKRQYGSIAEIRADQQAAEKKLENIRAQIKRADQIENELTELTLMLASQENGMPSGDLNSWIFETIRTFKLSYRVDIPQFSTTVVGDNSLLPRFPYQQVTATVSGTAFYHDFGRFVADFENEFPHIRIVNLDLGPAAAVGPVEREKLLFKMDIVALVKPNPV